MNVAIVGCGNIAGHYAKRIAALEPLRLVGVTDTVAERAEALAEEYGVRQFASFEELLGDDEVEIVVNLTVPAAHAPVTTAALEAGKHVHSEKPLALTYDEARELVELSERTGRRLSCSPATLLGEAAQTAWKVVRDGALATCAWRSRRRTGAESSRGTQGRRRCMPSARSSTSAFIH